MIILAMRHGDNRLPTIEEIRTKKKFTCKGLRQKGFHRVKQAVPHLKTRNISAIYSSPILRAVQSATIISIGLVRAFETHPLIQDISVEPGQNLVLAAEKIYSGEKSFAEYWIEGLPGIETPAQYIGRIRQAINQIKQWHKPGETILLVCHGETIWALMTILQRIPIEEAVKTDVGYAQIFEFKVNP